MRQVFQIRTSLFKTFLALPIFLFGVSSIAEQKCIRHQNEIHKVPSIEKAINQLGGIDHLSDVWKFPGLLGMGQTSIIFSARPEGLKAKVNDTPFYSILICESDRERDFRKGVFEIKILGNDGKIMRSVFFQNGTGSEMRLAQDGPELSFYSFNRASTPISVANVDRLPASSGQGTQ